MSVPPFFAVDPHGNVQILVKVVPRGSANRVERAEGSALKVRITAPPVEGKANHCLLHFLAEFLSVRTHQLDLITGQNARLKRIRITGLDPESRQALLARLSSL